MATAPDRTAFDWPVPLTLEVTDRARKKGKLTKVTWQLAIDSAPEESALRVRTLNVEVPGLRVLAHTDPTAARMMALANRIPPFLVTTEGEFIEMERLDEMIDALFDEVPSGGSEDFAFARELMKSPEWLEMMQQKVADPWRYWVELWILDPLPALGQSIVREDTELGRQRWTLEHVDPDGSISMTYHRSWSGDGGEIQWAVDDALGAASDEAKIERLEHVIDASVVTDPRTLLPREAKVRTVVRMWTAGRTEPMERIDEHDYELRLPGAAQTE